MLLVTRCCTSKNLVTPFNLAERTGLEPATLGVTGRYSNQLNYRSKLQHLLLMSLTTTTSQKFWRPQGDSNPRTHRERVMS